MLSYQHLYHAGNPADIHKHAALAWMLDYLLRKDKPLSYLETHAGRGLYDLEAAEARKTGEAAAGAPLLRRLRADHPLRRVLDEVRADHGDAAYPGSPLIAARMLRPEDRIHLAELHPQEHAALDYALSPFGARLYRQDGFEMVQSVAPPTPRRGLVLIDPSYEVAGDYADMPGRIAALHRKWNVGIVALWYPLLKGGAHSDMLAALERLDLVETLRHEVRFPPVRAGHRMIGSGLFVVNPPFGLRAACAELAAIYG
jgi:23S rRNA (adenine2030-N6)-methyltransferase